MWTAKYQHWCSTNAPVFINVTTPRHPVLEPTKPPPCEVCGKHWVLASYIAPVADVVKERQRRIRKGGFKSEQMELF